MLTRGTGWRLRASSQRNKDIKVKDKEMDKVFEEFKHKLIKVNLTDDTYKKGILESVFDDFIKLRTFNNVFLISIKDIRDIKLEDRR